ncbi:hypothetical protein ACFQZC_03430 [Streptacidiphilus monticola]
MSDFRLFPSPGGPRTTATGGTCAGLPASSAGCRRPAIPAAGAPAAGRTR